MLSTGMPRRDSLIHWRTSMSANSFISFRQSSRRWFHPARECCLAFTLQLVEEVVTRSESRRKDLLFYTILNKIIFVINLSQKRGSPYYDYILMPFPTTSRLRTDTKHTQTLACGPRRRRRRIRCFTVRVHGFVRTAGRRTGVFRKGRRVRCFTEGVHGFIRVAGCGTRIIAACGAAGR